MLNSTYYAWIPEITKNRLSATMSKSLIKILGTVLTNTISKGQSVRFHIQGESDKSILIPEKELTSAIYNHNLTDAGLDSFLISKGMNDKLSYIRVPGCGSIYLLPISENCQYLGHTWIMDDRGSSPVRPYERIHILEKLSDSLPFEADMSESFNILYAGNSDQLTRRHLTGNIDEIANSILYMRQGDKVWHKVMIHDSVQNHQTPPRVFVGLPPRVFVGPPPVPRKTVTSNQNHNIQCQLPDGSPFLVNTFDKEVVRLLAILYICKKTERQDFTKEEMSLFLERKKYQAEEISRSGRLVPFLKNLYNTQMNVHRENFALAGHIHWMYTEEIDVTSREIIFE